MGKFSVVITTYKFEETFRKTLESINNQDYDNFEIIIVDSSIDDCIYRLIKNYQNIKYIRSSNYERSAKRNEGVKFACGDYVVIVDSDMILSKSVLSECWKNFSINDDLKMLCIPERSCGNGFWSNCKSLERTFYDDYKWMQAARVFKKDCFMEFNGYDSENTGSEDYDLPRRVEFKYGSKCVGMITNILTQQEGQINIYSQFKKKFMYAKSFIKYSQAFETKGSFNLQASLIYRYWIFLKHYRKGKNKRNIYIGVFLLKGIEFIAGGIGYIYYKYINNDEK